MTEEREGADRKSEDLFEDLDAFFAPIGDLDAEELSPPVSPPPRAPGDATGAPGEEQEPEEEILPSGWNTGLGEVDTGAPPPPTPQEPDVTGPDSTSGAVHLGEGTSELAGEEWDSFRDALESVDIPRDDSPVPSSSDAYERATEGGEPLAPAEPAGGEEGSGITLEDLQAAPPVYRNLPGPDDEAEPVGVRAGAFEDDEEEEAAADAWGPAGSTMDEAGIQDETVPSLENVEAAADHFAESMREDPTRVEEDLLADLDRAEESPPTVRVGPEERVQPDLEAPPADEPRRRLRVGAVDALSGGPSWQEPSGEDIGVEAETGPPAAARNIPAAFLSAVILAGLGLGSLAIGAGPFAVVAGVIVLLAQGELYGAMVKARYQPATAVGLLFGGFVLAAGYLEGEAAMLSMVALSVVFTFLWFMATPARARRNTLVNIATTVLGVAYVPFFAGYALVIASVPGEGRGLLIAVLGLTFLHDIAGFVGGAMWGSRPLAPSISPKKSWEGLVVATLVVVAVGALALPQVDAIGTVGRALGLALTIAVFAPLGDLAESLLKRDLAIKDMGTLLPGHGGALDRIDSVLFTAPAAFYFFRLLA